MAHADALCDRTAARATSFRRRAFSIWSRRPAAIPAKYGSRGPRPATTAQAARRARISSRSRTSAITPATFEPATDIEFWINAPLPNAGGTPETLFVFGLDPAFTWFFALKAVTMRRMSPRSRTAPVSRRSRARSSIPISATASTSAIFTRTPGFPTGSRRLRTRTPMRGTARRRRSISSRSPITTTRAPGCRSPTTPGAFAGRGRERRRQFRRDLRAGVGPRIERARQRLRIARAVRMGGGQLRRVRRRGRLPDALHRGARESAVESGVPGSLEWCHPAPSDFDDLVVTAEGRHAVHLMASSTGRRSRPDRRVRHRQHGFRRRVPGGAAQGLSRLADRRPGEPRRQLGRVDAKAVPRCCGRKTKPRCSPRWRPRRN